MKVIRTIALQQLVRKNIWSMKPYSSARSEYSGSAEVFLDANENYRDYVGDRGRNRYPDPLQRQLKEKISEVFSIGIDHLFLGNGSDEAIDLLYRAFAEPGSDSAMILPPTYGVYSVFAHLNDVGLISIPLRSDYSIDVGQIEKEIEEDPSGMKLLFICSPNNPTGNDIPLEDIEHLLAIFPGIVVVDEAYQDFSSRASAASLLDAYENLVVLRTLSKAWGLANARLGMAFASPQIIRILTNIKYPYNISGPAQETALQALDHVREVREGVAEIQAARTEMIDAFGRISYVECVYRSAANFILLKVSDADRLYQELKDRGIIIRNRTHEPGCTGCVRITVGSPQENLRLLEALRTLEGTL
ncbi:MAG: histidinol-phosphate transaminase [Spirochaetia bacterium]|nr:histidinol-phosphate transaminase [Spirochaetia bacterium]